jgi:hypothetical protein
VLIFEQLLMLLMLEHEPIEQQEAVELAEEEFEEAGLNKLRSLLLQGVWADPAWSYLLL